MDRKESVVLKWVSTVDTAQQAARDQRQPAEGGRVTSTAGTRCRPSTVRAHYPQSTGTFFFFFTSVRQPQFTATVGTRYPLYINHSPQPLPVPGVRQLQSLPVPGIRQLQSLPVPGVRQLQSLPVPGVRQPVTAGTRCTSASHCRYPVYVSHSERKEDVSLWKLLI